MTPNEVANEIGSAIARVIGPDAVPGPSVKACAEINAEDFERCRLAMNAGWVGFDPDVCNLGSGLKIAGVFVRKNAQLGKNEMRVMVHAPEHV